MATTLNPEMEVRIADLAKRLGFAGPGAAERVLKAALDDLDANTPNRKMTPDEIEAEIAYWSQSPSATERYIPLTTTIRRPGSGRKNCTTSGAFQNNGC